MELTHICKSACPVQFFAEEERSGFNRGVPKIFKQQSQYPKIMTIIYQINYSTSKLFNEVCKSGLKEKIMRQNRRANDIISTRRSF